MAIASDILAKQNELLNLVGTDLTFEDVNGNTRTIRGAVIPFGQYDGELINALGISGRKIQVGPVNPAPLKFDQVTENVTGMVYTVHDVRSAVVDGTLIGFTCVCSGL